MTSTEETRRTFVMTITKIFSSSFFSFPFASVLGRVGATGKDEEEMVRGQNLYRLKSLSYTSSKIWSRDQRCKNLAMHRFVRLSHRISCWRTGIRENVPLQKQAGIVSSGFPFLLPEQYTSLRPPNIVLPRLLLCQLFTDTPTCLSLNSSVTK